VGGTLAKKAIAKKYNHVSCENYGGKATAEFGQALAEGLIMGSYQFNDYLTKKKDELFELDKVTVSGGSKVGLSKGSFIANGVCFARNLGNHPGNVSTPTRLAEDAKKIGRRGKMKVTVFDREKFTELGMGALAGVAAGTDEPPKFILMEYWGTKKSVKPKVLVGKGLTFDSGGISIKPASKMDEMKFDMCGAASVIGTMQVMAELKVPINIVGVVASAENMPGGKATKPGDVVKTMSGLTVEILNTDAEGRLVLADALTYVKKFNPKSVVDIATLTGACIVALGHSTSGLLSNDDRLAQKLLTAGTISNDRAWQLPIWDVYQKDLDSNFADIANIGGRAGTITAACFLSRFTKDYSWAHLDVAGTAHLGGASKGASGRPVPLLSHYLLDQS